MKNLTLLTIISVLIWGNLNTVAQTNPKSVEYILSWDVAPTASTPEYKQEHYSVWISTTGNNPADFTTMLFEETLSTTHPSWEFVNRTVNLDVYANITVYIAFRHHDVTDMDRIVIDNVMIHKTEGSIKSSKLVFLSEDFEGYENHADFVANSGWTLIDSDGDGHNWYLHFDSVDENFVMASRSWLSGTGALTPDNWLITPAVLLGTVGVNELPLAMINIFPNPATSVVMVLSNSDIQQIELVNMLGAVVLRKTASGQNINLDVSAHNWGVYFLRMHTDDGVVVKKLHIIR